MRTPIIEFAKNEKVSLRFIYKEIAAKRLVAVKYGSRTFIDDIDAERWRALAPKIGATGDVILDTAVRAVEALGRAIQHGEVDHNIAVSKMREVSASSGLNRAAA
jgi:hypothetical protein